jgi:creatinine amidohydrolase
VDRRTEIEVKDFRCGNRQGTRCGDSRPRLSAERSGSSDRSNYPQTDAFTPTSDVLKFAAEGYSMTISKLHGYLLVILLHGALFLSPAVSIAQTPSQPKLSTHWEELTASDFREGIRRAQGACLLPIGILEKHGPHLPLGTDLLDVRYAALHAAEQEYVLVFPEYYFGQIAEAKHEPGTISYSRNMQLALLQETTDEMARNGCRKVIIVNGHGGNESLLPFFAQTQLDKPHDYVVYVFDERTPQSGGPPKKTTIDMHAGESETSKMMISRPDLVHMDRAANESGADQHHQNLPDSVYTGIWWYARFPFHYSGDGTVAAKELGEYQMNWWVDNLTKAIRAVKADDASLKLQNEFYEKSKHPLDTQP